MRIIGGKFKARRIEVPSNITARPTTDFAKEGLFNLLNIFKSVQTGNNVSIIEVNGCPSNLFLLDIIVHARKDVD